MTICYVSFLFRFISVSTKHTKQLSHVYRAWRTKDTQDMVTESMCVHLLIFIKMFYLMIDLHDYGRRIYARSRHHR
jgi:hypothetical protein